MESLFKKKEFFNQIEFCGTLKKESAIAENLHVVVEYPQNTAGKITGFIIGNNETYDRIVPVFNESAINISLSSIQNEESPKRIQSDTFNLKVVGNRSWPKEQARSMQSIIAEFDLNDLTVEYMLHGDFPQERSVVFFLVGPRSFWPVSALPEFKEIGEFKTELFNKDFPIQLEFPAEVSVRPSYLLSNATDKNRIHLLTDPLVIHVKTNEDPATLSDDDMIQYSTKFADDILLLASFASGKWIDWYRREVFTPRMHQTYLKKEIQSYVDKVERDDLLIDPMHAYEFLATSLSEYRKLQSQNFDLYNPLIYFVGGCEARYLEEQFSLLYFALEKVKDLYSIDKGYKEILTEKAFSGLRSELWKFITEKITDSEKLKWIEKKLPELNRPPIHDIVEEKMFREYGIEWKDLYPSNSDLKLFNIRHKLFHTADRPDIDVLGDEMERLKFIVARLVLKVLGWRGHSNAPSVHILKFLQKK